MKCGSREALFTKVGPAGRENPRVIRTKASKNKQNHAGHKTNFFEK